MVRPVWWSISRRSFDGYKSAFKTFRALVAGQRAIRPVDSRVYDRLVAVKKEVESLSEAIDRLLAQVGIAHTGRDILRGRAREGWNELDLR